MQLVSGPHSYQNHSQGPCYLSPGNKYKRSLRARLHSNHNCNKLELFSVVPNSTPRSLLYKYMSRVRAGPRRPQSFFNLF